MLHMIGVAQDLHRSLDAHHFITQTSLTGSAATESRKGASFTAMGSPFGALAPAHFLNHTAAGVISNVLRPTVRSGQVSSVHVETQ